MKKPRLLVPETVQTSAMDCGPACLRSLLEGFGVPVSYDRLREACQTDLDGTSINTIEQVAKELGLDAQQVIVPVDHLLLDKAKLLPALAVVRLPNSFTHFVIVWRRHGRWLQVMDPATGREWPVGNDFLQQLHVHSHRVAAAAWREWAGTPDFLEPLRERASRIGLSPAAVTHLIETAVADSDYRSLASLDAVIRMAGPMVKYGRIPSSAAATIVQNLFDKARTENPFHVIPPAYWTVLPARESSKDGQQLVFRGAVLLRVRGAEPQKPTAPAQSTKASSPPVAPAVAENLRSRPPLNAGRELLKFLREDGLLKPAVLAVAMGLSALGLVVEALLYRAFIDLAGIFSMSEQRLVAVAILLGLLLVFLVLELSIARGLLQSGRSLELRLRTHLLKRLPLLPDRYFASRLVSDMAERSHSIQEVRGLPTLGGRFIHSTFELLLTAAGVFWLDPGTAPWVLMSATFAVVSPALLQGVVAERDLRFRTHAGALCRFYFDALRGLMPIRTHAAENAVRSEHEAMLVDWAKAGIRLQRIGVLCEATGLAIGFALTAAIVWSHISHARESSVGLLLVYWALNVPALGMQVANIALQYPRQKNLAARLLEPLVTPTDDVERRDSVIERTPLPIPADTTNKGVRIEFRGVSVRAIGRTILEEFTLEIKPGSHVCIVGRSGAGKSSLVGLLLGWHQPAQGEICIDGQPLRGAHLEWLRENTAWVDPNVQIWNRPLLDNLQYGTSPEEALPPVSKVLEDADLLTLLRKLPDGLQTRLGESGALTSGGEGQRVRLGRALFRPDAKLVILDEAFTALDREKRRKLLARVRETWRKATVLCITHDVADSRDFDRVLVLEQGRIVEDSSPEDLLSRKNSRYGQLLRSESLLQERIWSDGSWRRIFLQNGKAIETETRIHDDGTTADILARIEGLRSSRSTR